MNMRQRRRIAARRVGDNAWVRRFARRILERAFSNVRDRMNRRMERGMDPFSRAIDEWEKELAK